MLEIIKEIKKLKKNVQANNYYFIIANWYISRD